jgi:FixJ family two-component response regulator
MTTTIMNPLQPCDTRDLWRPVAYVSMQDRPARDRIVNLLERSGWTVLAKPTGFHVLQAIADVIDGHREWLRPGLIVIDAHARGCAGTTIAAGLRDLGIAIPIVLIAAPGASLPVSSDRTLRIVESAAAEAAVTEIALGIAPPPDRGHPTA